MMNAFAFQRFDIFVSCEFLLKNICVDHIGFGQGKLRCNLLCIYVEYMMTYILSHLIKNAHTFGPAHDAGVSYMHVYTYVYIYVYILLCPYV
jgi:hypothetical protein